MVLYEDDMDYDEEPFTEEIVAASNEDYTIGLNISVRDPTPEDSNAMILLGSKASSVKKDDDQKSANVESLDGESTEKLLARLPQLEKSTSEDGDFFMREKSLKPPRTADINEIAFPPEEKLEKPEQVRKEEEALLGSSLAVVRYLPEGPVDRSVPHISITFSQPMVAVSGVEDVHQDFSFVKIEPFPKNGGRFRWMGAKTLFFEPNYRFDMSTEYTVTVDCEKTKSSVGGVLEKNVSFKFETPRLTLLNHLPNGYHAVPINEFPIVYMEFDQDIDPNQILSSVNISGYSCKLVQNDGRTSVVKSYIYHELTLPIEGFYQLVDFCCVVCE